MEEILEEAQKLSIYCLCDACLGRQFAQVEHGMTNSERGERIRALLHLPEKSPDECWLCEGLTGEIEKFAKLAIEKLKEYEHDTFLVGCRIDEEILRKEREVATPHSESIKREINREVGKIVAQESGKTPEFVHPDIVVIVNTLYDLIELEVNPLFIYGRYRKLVRGIPQTKWYCRKCRGRGCDYCGHTGKMYEESVEELIAHKALELFGAEDESFHGAGREDIDVRMLGNGRPFILELKNPRKRHINLEKLQGEINKYAQTKVTVDNLRYARREEVEELKNARHPKTYRITIAYEGNGKLNEAVNALRGAEIAQRTPTRVSHRRADKVRYRKVMDMRVENADACEATLVVKAEAGTYIKELVTGDDGRTTPSLSELAGMTITVKELDVIEIGDEK